MSKYHSDSSAKLLKENRTHVLAVLLLVFSLRTLGNSGAGGSVRGLPLPVSHAHSVAGDVDLPRVVLPYMVICKPESPVGAVYVWLLEKSLTNLITQSCVCNAVLVNSGSENKLGHVGPRSSTDTTDARFSFDILYYSS
ncbi:hypothetical protein SRHO_G00069140 [Serrasalmus rhombeus]